MNQQEPLQHEDQKDTNKMSDTTKSSPCKPSTILDAALEMADNGIPVFPVSKTKMPVWSNKMLGVDRGGGGLKAATTDPDRLEYLFTDPSVVDRITGIGRPTGKVSGVTVVDVDCGKGKKSRDQAVAWLEKNRPALRAASVVRTMSGGLHYLMKYNPDIPSSGNTWGPGVDCRNDGGYVCVPPFMGYSWQRIIDPDDWALPPAPPPKATDVPKGEYFGGTAEAVSGETPEHIKALIKQINEADGDDQGWHESAIRLVAFCVGSGWSDAEILRHAVQWTRGGYTHRETFEDMCVQIAGARAKWAREKAQEQVRGNAVSSIKANVMRLTRNQIIDLHKALGDMVDE